MASYRDSETGFDPMGRQRPATGFEKALAVVAIVAAIIMLAGAFSHGKGGPAFLDYFDWGTAPLGLIQLGIAWTYIERAGANRPEERYSQRTLRWTALSFVFLGAVLIGVGVYDHFRGAGA
jgi:hypothetical protein